MTHTGPDMGTEPNFMALAATFAEAQIAGDKDVANQAIDEVAAAVNEFNREAKVGRYSEGLPHTARVAMAETILKAAGGDVSDIDWVDDDTYYNSDGIAAPDFIKSATGSLVRADKPTHEPLNPVVDLTETASDPADLTELCEQNPLFADLVYEFIDSILENGAISHPKLQTRIYERFDLIARTLRPEQAAALKEELDDVMASSLALRDLGDTQTDDDDLLQAEVRPADQDDDPDAVWKPVTELFPPTGTIEIPEHLKQRAEAARKRVEEARKADEAAAQAREVRTSEEAKKEKVQLDVGVAEKEDHGEDTILRDDNMRLYGVFDGMGSGANPKFASQLAADVIRKKFTEALEYSAMRNPLVVENLFAQSFEDIRERITQEAPHDVTTATVVHIVYQAEPYLVWANAGDSRLFVAHKDGTFEAVSTDQSQGNRIENGLGKRHDNWPIAADEFGTFPLQEGDQIMICSDGITGDWERQFLSDDEMRQAFSGATAQEVADRFLKVSKKHDDKSVVVVRV